MTDPLRMPARIGAVVLVSAMLGGCSVTESRSPSSGGSTLGNLLKYGSTTEPPIAPKPLVEAADCPNVLVIDGRSAIRQGSSQISIAHLARECIERENGAVVVKVGVEGLALLGQGSAAGRFDVPVTFQIRRGDTILASRVRRVSVAIPPGGAQASFTAVEGDLVVPPNTGEFDIEVGLGGAARPERSSGGRRR